MYAIMARLFSRILFLLLGFLVLVAFSYLGEFLSPMLPISIPGPLIGMLLLFLMFIVLGDVPSGIESATKPFLSHMSLLFIPAILGVWHYQALIKLYWLPLSLVVVVTTIFALAVTAVIAEKSQRRSE